MNQAETKRFEELYQRHITLLKLQGKSQKTIDAYSRAIRRARVHFGCCPDKITPKQFESYFAQLVDTHSRPEGGDYTGVYLRPITHSKSFS